MVFEAHLLLLLLLFGVQHDVACRCDTHGHLHERPEGVEAREVPDQRVHHLTFPSKIIDFPAIPRQFPMIFP